MDASAGAEGDAVDRMISADILRLSTLRGRALIHTNMSNIY